MSVYGDYKAPAGYDNDTDLAYETGTLAHGTFVGGKFTGVSPAGHYGEYKYNDKKRTYRLETGIKITENRITLYDSLSKYSACILLNASDIIFVHFSSQYVDVIIDWTQFVVFHIAKGKKLLYIDGNKQCVTIDKAFTYKATIDMQRFGTCYNFTNGYTLLPYDYSDDTITDFINRADFRELISAYYKMLNTIAAEKTAEKAAAVEKVAVDKAAVVEKAAAVDDNHGQCTICLSDKAIYILDVCFHLVYCEECNEKGSLECPICRKANISKKRIYIP